MNYAETLKYIHSVSWLGSRPGLGRITELCRRIGNPEDSLSFIHVTGTNGKGSTCSMTESILRHAGYKTGLFTSPFVREFNERIAINGAPVSNELLCIATEIVKTEADKMTESPTEFELITAIALVIFKMEKCDEKNVFRCDFVPLSWFDFPVIRCRQTPHFISGERPFHFCHAGEKSPGD